jgi:hypothetical protein
MKQRTLHLSFTKNDGDLFMELMRHSAKNYLSASNQARIWMRQAIEQESNKSPSPSQHEANLYQ